MKKENALSYLSNEKCKHKMPGLLLDEGME